MKVGGVEGRGSGRAAGERGGGWRSLGSHCTVSRAASFARKGRGGVHIIIYKDKDERCLPSLWYRIAVSTWVSPLLLWVPFLRVPLSGNSSVKEVVGFLAIKSHAQ